MTEDRALVVKRLLETLNPSDLAWVEECAADITAGCWIDRSPDGPPPPAMVWLAEFFREGFRFDDIVAFSAKRKQAAA